MVIHSSSAGMKPTVARFREFVRGQVDLHTAGNRAAFCRSIGFSEFAISGWLNKGERPSPSMFLAFCYGTQTDPAKSFIQGPALENPPNLRILADQFAARAKRPKLSANQRAKMRDRLQEHFFGSDKLSATAIAQRIGLTRSCLRYWFPELFAAFVAQHKKHREESAKTIRERRNQKTANAIAEIRRLGGCPSKRKIMSFLRPKASIKADW